VHGRVNVQFAALWQAKFLRQRTAGMEEERLLDSIRRDGMSQIGKPDKKVTVQPAQEPVPERATPAPAIEPQREPVPEKVA